MGVIATQALNSVSAEVGGTTVRGAATLAKSALDYKRITAPQNDENQDITAT